MINRDRRGISELREESGQDVIEFALIFPLLLLLLVGIMVFGIVIFQFNTVGNAAREGARAGIVSSATNAQIVSAASAMTSGLDSSRLQINVLQSCSSVTSNQVQVEVLYDADLVVGPFLIGGTSSTLPLRSVATMRCE